MLQNKVVIVTGGSAGIGAATAECFAKEGASIAIVGRNEVKLKDVAKRCEYHGAKVLIIKADISKDDEAATIVKRTIEKFGKLDVLINNAGILKFTTILDSNVLETFDDMIRTNLRAAIFITHLAIPHLQKTKGNIVNVSSVLGKKALPATCAYSISKAGLDRFTKCTALELGSSGVRINSVNPGPVPTDMLDMFDSYEYKGDKTVNDLTGRGSESKEIGDFILYLASDKAKSITGSCHLIDNGARLM